MGRSIFRRAEWCFTIWPVEYLAWFARKGAFPKGRLGELLRIVHQMKVDGLDEVFDEFRRRAGGKTPLRTPNRQGNQHFE
ncbi:MAG: DUF3820 family protein [Chthoniobacter sp.]